MRKFDSDMSDKSTKSESIALFMGNLEELSRMVQRVRLSPLETVNALTNSALTVLLELLRQDIATTATMPKLNLKKAEGLYPYKKATLHDCNGDLTGRWFVNYGIYDHKAGKVVRRRLYKQFTHLKTLEERYKKAEELITTLNKQLPFASLNNPELEAKEKARPEFLSLSGALFEMIAKNYDIRDARKTHHAHKSHARKLVEWADSSPHNFYKVERFKKRHAQEYVDWLKTTGVSSQTVRNSAAGVRALFSHMVNRDLIESNPFDGVKLPSKTRSDYHQAFNQGEIKRIKSYLLEHDPYLWSAIEFIYYTYLRPIEIGRLQVEDIHLEDRQIFFPGTKSKNKKGAFLEIPPPLVETLQAFELDKYHPKDYVFTASRTPGKKPLSINYLSSRFKRCAIALELEEKKTLYSWKHTGVVAAYNNGVDIKAIQRQCRHASIEQTDIYLKSLGFNRNETFSRGVKKL